MLKKTHQQCQREHLQRDILLFNVCIYASLKEHFTVTMTTVKFFEQRLAKTFPGVQRGKSKNSSQNFNKLLGLLMNEPVVLTLLRLRATWQRHGLFRTAFTLLLT